MTKKRILSIALASLLAFLTLSGSGVSAGAEAYFSAAETAFVAIGTRIGDSGVYWEYENGVLTLSGTGEMPDFAKESQPWRGEMPAITEVVIGNGVESVGNFAFFGASALKKTAFPKSVARIGAFAFYGCEKLASVTNDSALLIEPGSPANGYAAFYCDSVTAGGETLTADKEMTFETAAKRILAGIEGNSSLSDVEKALLIHDRLVVWCEYDEDAYRYLDDEEIPPEDNTAEGALLTRRCICVGYTEAYIELLRRVGIEATECPSYEMGHLWCIVTLDGVRYHADLTWDDPLQDAFGRASHECFLVSSETLAAHDHGYGDYDTTPNDKRYESCCWAETDSPFCLYGNKIYFIDNDNFLCEWNGNSPKRLFAIEKKNAFGFHPLASSCEGLLYSSGNEIWRYVPEKGTKEKIYSLNMDSAGGDLYLAGFKLENEHLYLQVYSQKADAVSVMRVGNPAFDASLHSEKGLIGTGEWRYCAVCGQPVSGGIPKPGPEYKPGDVNGDDAVTITDYLMVKAHVLGTKEFDAEQKARMDVNEDDAINVIDYLLVKKIVLEQ